MRLYRVANTYNDGELPRRSGHRVIAENADEAVRVARKHGIGTPWGRECAKRHALAAIRSAATHGGGSLWVED
ncbi:unnamed protein product, partial [marine sediment metagenome]